MEIQYRQCKCEICNSNIKDDNIYLFPCGHMFDSKCIIEMMFQYREFLPDVKTKTDEIAALTKEIDLLEKRKIESKKSNEGPKNEKGFFSGLGIFGNDKDKNNEKILISNDDLKRLDELKEKLSEILSEECVLCGDYMVESTQCDFVGDKASWTISK